MRPQPFRQVRLLRLRECRRLVLNDIMDPGLEAFALKALYHGRKNVGRQVVECVSHPYTGSTGHIIDDINHTLCLNVRGLGRTTAEDGNQLARGDEGCHLCELVLILDRGGFCAVSPDFLPVCHFL